MTVTVNEETGEITEDDEPKTPTPSPDEAEEAADEDEQPAAPDDDEVPHAGALTEDEQTQVFDKALKRAKTYMMAVPGILGDSAQDLSPCPRCTDFLPGWILPLQIKPVPDEQKYAVKVSIGELAGKQLQQDKHSSRCPDCGGEGKVDTGSLVPSQREARCEACEGRGWVGPRAARLAPAPATPTLAAVPDAGHPEGEQPAQDPWGRFQDDPLYGVMPGFERS